MTTATANIVLVQGCPLDQALKFLSSEWTAHIVWTLGRSERMRFGELRRALPGEVSARVLSARLKQLAEMKLVHREDIGSVPPHVVYSLTPEGKRLDQFLIAIEKLAEELPFEF